MLGFPFHLPSILLVLRDRFYFLLFLTFNVVRWGVSEVWTMCFSLTIWCKKGGVEDIVYLPLRGKLELIGESGSVFLSVSFSLVWVSFWRFAVC